MFNLPLHRVPLCMLLASCAASAQVLNMPGDTGTMGTTSYVDAIQRAQLNMDLYIANSRDRNLTNDRLPTIPFRG